MQLSNRDVSRLVLFTLLILIVPMVTFPALLGTTLLKASMLFGLYELAFYAIVTFIFHRQANLLQLVQAAGLCLVYRLAVGAVFGVLIAVMYAMDMSVSVTLGISSYVPAIALHVLATPFILKPAIDDIIPVRRRRVAPPQPEAAPTPQPVAPRPQVSERVKPAQPVPAADPSATGVGVTVMPMDKEIPGFDRATRYIGEDGSVQIAAVVDHEGLLLSNYRRGNLDPEDWAPLALLMVDAGGAVMGRAGLGVPERLSAVVDDFSVTVVRESGCYLLVVAEKRGEDLLRVRINQAREMIRKYIEERYAKAENEPKLESKYV
ncbi:MAG: hypothetical protein D6800_14865 [Candidatus Zixiibacteriota bacterium]|nr:MAG: hypothetical protein D6800_14865 [candidate division Zixibacteria bacterium]